MKFGFFSYFAREAFITTSTGEKVFHLGKFWSYLIPDVETENRLCRKTVTAYWVAFAVALILELLPLFNIVRVTNGLWLGLYIAATILLAFALFSIILKDELSKLERSSTHLSILDFYQNIARRDSYFSIEIRLISSIILAGIFSQVLLYIKILKYNISLGWQIWIWILIGMLLYSSIIWVYVLDVLVYKIIVSSEG